MPITKVIQSTGRRKSASAQARLLPGGTGTIAVNGLPFEDYFTTRQMRGYIMQPVELVNAVDKYDIKVNVKGGGKMGQAGAMRHALARALQKDEETLRAPLKEAGMLTRDPREKERKKTGQPGARKRFQFSKR